MPAHQRTHTTTHAGASYCTSSIALVLINKFAVSGFGLQSLTCLLLFQCLVALAIIVISYGLRGEGLPRVPWGVVRAWAPVNVIFVGMLWTSFIAFRYLSVPMLTVLKVRRRCVC